ncbi:MAG: OmpH family outer membrane protein [Verrucomicrobiota bacterium]|nr:OmpH family outer membrane protein [Roseibacillus sp.]MEE2623319.1 OmpH family outer membrane protein [Verrucomicrobiota bacterium]
MRRLMALGLGVGLAFPDWAQSGNEDQEKAAARQGSSEKVAGSAEEEKLRTAVVNIQKLFRNYHKVDKAEEEINMERARIQKEHNDVAGRLRSMDQSLRELEISLQSTNLTGRNRSSLEREKGVRFHERERINHERRSDLQARHTELNRKMVARMDALLKEIQDLVAVQAEGLGFDLVFDIDGTSTSQVPMLLFARDAMDITPMMLKELNKNAPSRG